MNYFKMEMLDQTINYINEKYAVTGERTSKEFPHYLTFRHKQDHKCFALIMNVPMNKLGLTGTQELWIIDLKLKPELIGMLQQKKGYFPAYHMNKEHWISVILNDDTDFAELKNLIDESYQITSN